MRYVKVIFEMDFADKYNLFVGTALGVISTILGPHWYLFLGLALLNMLDYITGTVKARKRGEESSDKGWPGLAKKVFYWVVIAVAFIVSFIFSEIGKDLIGVDLSFMYILGWSTIALFVVNEARSVLENCVQMGIYVPAVLVKGLAVAQKLTESKVEEALPEVEDESNTQAERSA